MGFWPALEEAYPEIRQQRCWMYRVLPRGVGTESWHDHFRTPIRVHPHTERFTTRLKDWEVSEETAYYLSDLVLPAGQSNQAIRGHRGVENRTHYVRDTRMDEDASRIRRNPIIFGLLRSFALNLLRFNKIENIRMRHPSWGPPLLRG